ncbi:MAG: ATP-binding protein [Nitrospirota bacterium]
MKNSCRCKKNKTAFSYGGNDNKSCTGNGETRVSSDVMQSLSAFRRIASTLSEKFDVKEICDQVVKVLADELGMEYCSIMLVDEDEKMVVNQAGIVPQHEPSNRIFLNRAFRLGEGVAGMAAEKNQSILITDVEHDTRFLKIPSSIKIKSLLCLPMSSKGKVVGVLNLSHPKKNFFNENHESVFSILATLVGQLITFANLQRELEELNRDLEIKVMERTREIKESYEKLMQTEKLASLGTLISGVAHELNNKLVPILAYSELLERSYSDERELNFSKAIHKSAIGAKYIVESLLRFSRQEKPKKVNLNINDVIRDVLSILRYRLNNENIELSFILDNNLPVTLADRYHMEQVIINIINNACHAIGRGGGKLTIRTFVSEDNIIIEINDTGCGIPDENLNKIFDPFFTSKEKMEGTGLGLSLCYGIINEHGGNISVKSKKGDTTFRISIPVVDERHKEISTSKYPDIKNNEADSHDLNLKKRILVIDDERYQLDLLKVILKKDFDISLADSGEEAIKLLKRNDFDLILSDATMPGIDGLKLYKWIRENKEEMKEKFIIMTGNILETEVRRFIEESGERVITKPYKVNELLNKVKQFTK